MYSFKSIADIERHMVMQHDATGSDVNPFGYKCNFKLADGKVCDKVFKSRYFLTKHKNQTNHVPKKK